MKQMPLLLLLVSATALVTKAPFVGEEHRYELMLGVLSLGGALILLRGLGVPLLGLLGAEEGRRPWIAIVGAAVLVTGIVLARWNAQTRATIRAAASPSATTSYSASVDS